MPLGPVRQTLQNTKDISELEKNGIRDVSLRDQIANYDTSEVKPREDSLMGMFNDLDSKTTETDAKLAETDTALKDLATKTTSTEDDYDKRARFLDGANFDNLFSNMVVAQDKTLSDGKTVIDGDIESGTKPDTILGRLGFENIPIGRNRFGFLEDTALGPALDQIQAVIDRVRQWLLGFIDNFSERLHSIDGRGGLIRGVLAEHNREGGIFDQFKEHIEAFRVEVQDQINGLRTQVENRDRVMGQTIVFEAVVGYDLDLDGKEIAATILSPLAAAAAIAAHKVNGKETITVEANGIADAHVKLLQFAKQCADSSVGITYAEAIRFARDAYGDMLRDTAQSVKDFLRSVMLERLPELFRNIATALAELVLFPINVIQDNLGLPETEAGRIMGLVPQLTRMTDREFVNFQASEGALVKGPFQSGNWRPTEWAGPGFTELG